MTSAPKHLSRAGLPTAAYVVGREPGHMLADALSNFGLLDVALEEVDH